MAFLLSSGYTEIDNATQVKALLEMPDRCTKAYLFLLSRRKLRPENRSAHWGEIAAAIGKGHTQTFACLGELKELGLIQGDGQVWIVAGSGNPESEQEVIPEIRRKSVRKSNRKSNRKSGMGDSENAVQHIENPAPEVREVREAREQPITTAAQPSPRPAPVRSIRPKAEPKDPTAFQLLFEVLAVTCYGGHDGLTAPASSRIGNAAKVLMAAGYAAPDVPLFAEVLEQYFDGHRDAVTERLLAGGRENGPP